MTKRLTITLVALALFVLIAVLPASAMSANPATGLFNGSVIMNGPTVPTVFIGEEGLNLTPRLTAGNYVIAASSPESFKIGWWAPGATLVGVPSQTLDISARYTNFYVSPTDFAPYLGNWYCLSATNTLIGPIFVVADPNQAVSVWDIRANSGLGQDMTGKSAVLGSALTVKIDTNLATFTTDSAANARGNVRFINTWDNGTPLTQLGVSNFWWLPFTGGYNRWITNATTGPVTPVLGSMLQFQNVSINRTNTFGNANYTRTMWFNNSPLVAGQPEAQMLTTTVAGNVLLASAQSLDVGPVDINGNAQIINRNPTAVDGFITIKLKDANSNVVTRVFTDWRTAAGAAANPVGTSASLLNLWVSAQPAYLGSFTGNNGLTATLFWDTGAIDPGLGTPAYPAGTYTVWTESTLSRMKDNYKSGTADFTGKTVSASGTVTLVSDTVKIEANKETIVRSKSFAITVTGRPLQTYNVWVKGTSSMSGLYDNQPPMITLFQDNVRNDTPWAGIDPSVAYPIGQYAPQNSNRVMRADVALESLTTGYNRTRYYTQITTSSSGTRVVEFVTTNMTKAQTYTIRVEQNMGTVAAPDFKGDEVDVKVEKGAVTITAAGDQSYYLGEEIKFSGTNTETQNTFLFLTGPNLHAAGSRFYPAAPYTLDPRRNPLDTAVPASSIVVDGNTNTFVVRAVNADNTWDWKWGTASYALDAGTYTVYAVSGPAAANNLGNVAYGTVSIIIKKPFISATASQSTVAQGDKLFITGTAEGKPQMGIAIWILGKNYANRVTQSVNSDASFSYEVTTATTATMDAGQYFIVAQHPMQNQVFDIAMCAGSLTQVCNLQQATGALNAQQIFTILGQGSLQGTDAAEALVTGINSPNVDDTYTKLVFLVEVPSIRIDPVGDRHVGDKFTITATTNLAVDDDVQMTVVSSSFKPTQKTQSGEFSGASGTVKVTKGDTGLNKLSFDVDASTFKPDEYIVTANRILQPATTATALFNVLEGSAPTAVPTKVVTAAPTVAVATTAAPTQPPTAAPTKTPTQPGFGALVALIGLGAVAFFVVRRH